MKRHTWVPVVAALAGTALTVKSLLLMVGGPDAIGAAEGGLYLGALLLGVVACVGFGLRQEGVVRRIGVGLGSVVLLVAWILGLGEVMEPLVGAVTEDTVIREETAVLVAGLVLLSVAGWLRSHDVSPETRVNA